jgi:hypothetical protein
LRPYHGRGYKLCPLTTKLTSGVSEGIYIS